jgi:hypothetical protein
VQKKSNYLDVKLEVFMQLETGSIKFVVGAYGNIHDKNNYKKCNQVSPVCEIPIQFLRKSITVITQIMRQFTDNNPDHEQSSKAT